MQRARLRPARLVQAAGGCAGLLLGRAIVRDTAESNDAVRRLALMSLMTMVGPGLAPLVGGLLASALGWRSIFVVLTAGYPGLSPMRGLTHGVHGIGDTIAISVHAAESAVGGPDGLDAYVVRLEAALRAGQPPRV